MPEIYVLAQIRRSNFNLIGRRGSLFYPITVRLVYLLTRFGLSPA